jgi:hypothetical protein
MKKALLVFVIGVFCLGSCCSISNAESSEVGRYQLLKINDGGSDSLYKIDSVTGVVWLYGPRVVESADDFYPKGDKRIEGLNKTIAELKRQGKRLYTTPYWGVTSERPDDNLSII